MRARSLSLIIVPLILMCTAGVSLAQDSYDKFWRSYVEYGFRGGDIFEAGQGNLFVPLRQTEVNMLFADVRGNWTDGRSAHGNFGLAFRQMLVRDWVFGIHGAYDIRHSPFGNNFHQGVIGLEMLHPDLGFRANGYLAGEGAKLLPGLNNATLIGNNLFVQQASERAYSGSDFEVEGRLWSHLGSSDNSWAAWHFYDWELWAAVGVYNYDNDAAGFESITGPRGRLELRMYDIPLAGPDSRLVFAAQIEDDDVRGDVKSAMMTVRIPFGKGTRYDRTRLRGPNRRIVAPIMRNTEIVSVVGQGGLEPAAFARSGEAVSSVVTLDSANNATLITDIATAGANSLVVLDGSAANLAPTGTIALAAGQTVMGGGSSLSVVGLNSGATAVFNAPGARPTIDSTAGTAFSMAEDSCLLGLNINHTAAGPAVLMDGIGGGLIQGVNINTSAGASPGIFVNNATAFSIAGVNIGTTGANSGGLQVLGDSDGAASGLGISTSGNTSPGVEIGGTSFLSLGNSSIFTSGAGGSTGILASDSAQLSVSGTSISVTAPGTTGVVADPGAGGAMAVALGGNVINASGGGIALGSGGFTGGSLDASVVGNTIILPPGADEISATTAGGTANLDIRNNTLDPFVGTIRLNEIGGDMNVVQGAPGAAGGIDSANNLPTTNVIIPGGAPDFMELPPIPPAP